MKKEAQYNHKTQSSSYAHNVNHGEIVPKSKVDNNAPTAVGQNLANTLGTNGAARSLRDRYMKK